MTLFNDQLEIRRYQSVGEIIEEYFKVRLDFYDRRIKLMIAEAEFFWRKADAKYRFVNEIIEKKIDINRKSKQRINEILEENDYPRYPAKFKAEGLMGEVMGTFKVDEVSEGDEEADGASYSYLTSMPFHSLSEETLLKLKEEMDHLEEKLEILKGQSKEDVWLSDLDEFEKEYLEWQKDWYTEQGIPLPAEFKRRKSRGGKIKLNRRISLKSETTEE